MKKLLICCIVPLLWACSNDDKGKETLPDAKPIELRAELVPKIKQDNLFAFDLFKQVHLSDESDNIFISPLSVSMALSMALNGAIGETREEMEKTLRISGFSINEINEYCKTLREALLKVDPSTEFSIANSIWYRSGFPVESDFLRANRTSFYAEVNDADFSDPSTLTRINKWCADNTRNRIPKILDQISEQAVMFLINAIYFKGIWRSEFNKDQTFAGDFFHENGTKQTVQMMKQTGYFKYYADNVADYLTLSYGNGAFSMRVLLPVEGKTVEDVINQLNPQSWYSSFNGSIAKINLQIPRFKAECTYKLEEKVLPEMGMRIPFSQYADFTGIYKGGDIAISKVVHKTYLSVDEKGTEAAAVTSIEIDITSSGPNVPEHSIDFFVNKPFVFVIQENSTGAILFIGSIKSI